MKYLALILFIFLPFTSMVNADPILNEDTVKAISTEMSDAFKNGDITTFEKYYYSGSDITIDTNPDVHQGEKKISYDELMKMTEMAFSMMKNTEIHEQILSISVDTQKNEAIIEEKTIATVEMMGMKLEDISINQTTYGIVNGEIKVLQSKDQLIKTGLVQ